jgi:hypothetical protein
MIKNLYSLSGEPNSNNVPSASSGFREWQGVRLWHADVEYSFVMIVEVLAVLTEAVLTLEG